VVAAIGQRVLIGTMASQKLATIGRAGVVALAAAPAADRPGRSARVRRLAAPCPPAAGRRDRLLLLALAGAGVLAACWPCHAPTGGAGPGPWRCWPRRSC